MEHNLASIVQTIRKWYDHPKTIDRDSLYQVLDSVDKVDSLIKKIDELVDEAYLKSFKKKKSSVLIDKEIRTWIREKLEEEYPVDRNGYLGTKIIDKNFNFRLLLKEIVREEVRHSVSGMVNTEIDKYKDEIYNKILDNFKKTVT